MKKFFEASKTRVLIVEDHPFQATAMERILNSVGFFQLCVALDVSEARALIAQGRKFELVICDQELGDGVGFDFIRYCHSLRAIESYILISAMLSPLDRYRILREARSIGLPLLECMEKPLSVVALRHLLLAASPTGRRVAD